MKLSQLFIHTQKESPKDAKIASHKLMLRASMIEQTASGIYAFLPLGTLVLNKIIKIIKEEHKKHNINEIIMPTLQSANLWKESGRYDDYGKELLKIKDRHENDLVYTATAEEQITNIFKKYVKSYKALPLNLYQINTKFRDEIRPRFGMIRGREFLMKDAYSFDISKSDATKTYWGMYKMYLDIFKKMGVRAIPFQADSGQMGGDLSHEFHISAKSGESDIYYDREFDTTDLSSCNFEKIKSLYSATGERHDPKMDGGNIKKEKGIEIGQIFYFGDKYSKTMSAAISGSDGKPIYPHMGSYGIGVSRVMAGIIESSHDDYGIIWPKPISPFEIIIIDATNGANDKANEIYENLLKKGFDIAIDNRDVSFGSKAKDADLIGIPIQIIIGKKEIEKNEITIKKRNNKEITQIKMGDIDPYMGELL